MTPDSGGQESKIVLGKKYKSGRKGLSNAVHLVKLNTDDRLQLNIVISSALLPAVMSH